jgi:hypothetical protein
MIDTVSLTHAMKPRLSERQLLNIGARHPKGLTHWAINPENGEASPSITFTMQPNGFQYLTARQSLPRLRHGHNATLPKSQADVYAELGLMAYAIYERTGIPFNPLTANVTGVHFTRDIRVGLELIAPTLRRIEARQLPRFQRVRRDHGVEYVQKGASIMIYSKHHQIQTEIAKGSIAEVYQAAALKASEGVLRVECKQGAASLDRLQQAAGMNRQARDVLTKEMSERVIAGFLKRIQFDKALEESESNKPLDRLIEFHGVRTAIRLFGFLSMQESYGKDFWKIESLNYSRKTYFTNLGLCRKAGVWAV